MILRTANGGLQVLVLGKRRHKEAFTFCDNSVTQVINALDMQRKRLLSGLVTRDIFKIKMFFT